MFCFVYSLLLINGSRRHKSLLQSCLVLEGGGNRRGQCCVTFERGRRRWAAVCAGRCEVLDCKSLFNKKLNFVSIAALLLFILHRKGLLSIYLPIFYCKKTSNPHPVTANHSFDVFPVSHPPTGHIDSFRPHPMLLLNEQKCI